MSRILARCSTTAACAIALAVLSIVIARRGVADETPRPAARWVARAGALDARIAAALAGGRTAEARVLADSAVAVRRDRLRYPPRALAAYVDSLALGFFGLGHAEGWTAASRYFEQSVEIKQRALGPDDLEVARTLSALATVDDYLGQWERASDRARRALAIRERASGPRDPLVAASLRQLGMARFELGDYGAADSLLVRSLAIYDSLPGDHADRIADARNNLGEIDRVRDRFDRAEAHFRRGLEVARSRLPPDAPLRVSLMNNLAGLYKDLARYHDAEPLLVESLRLREGAAEPDSLAIAAGHLNLAEVQRLQGRLAEAEPHYASGLRIARAILGAGHPMVAPFVNQAAVLYQELRDYDRSAALFGESVALAEGALGPDHPLVAQALDDFGRLLAVRGSHAAAESALTRALEIRIRRLGDDHPEVAVTRVHLVENAASDPARDAAASSALDDALVRLGATDAYPEARLDGHALRAARRERAGDLAGARADVSRALELVDSLRTRRGGGELSRAALLIRHLDLYDRGVRLSVAAGDVAGALEAHERGRARILLDQLGATGVDLRAGIPAADLEPLARDEAAARERLARAQRRLELEPAAAAVEAIERRNALEAARDSAAWDVQRALEVIRERNPVWRRILTANGRPASLREISGALGPREALLAYHLGPEASFAFLLESGGAIRVAPLAIGEAEARSLGLTKGPLTAAAVERAVAGDTTGPIAARAGIAAVLSGAYVTPGSSERAAEARTERLAALWRTLVPTAIADRIARAERLAIVPDGALHLLPFEALVTRRGEDGPRYWLDDGPAVRYAASATSLVALAHRPARSERTRGAFSVLSVSDPAFGGGERRWPRLPGSRLETAAIVGAFAPVEVDTLSGAGATERAVRARLARHGLIHLATHGFVTERRGDVLGGLVLAAPAHSEAGTEDDGLLQLFEIYGIELGADLVVLSACETARGPRVAGEGVFALSRGFIAAGAQRVVASLWSVSDASTAELMRELFGRLARARRAARAIDYPLLVRDAKRAVRARADYASPFHWAPFVLSGAW